MLSCGAFFVVSCVVAVVIWILAVVVLWLFDWLVFVVAWEIGILIWICFVLNGTKANSNESIWVSWLNSKLRRYVGVELLHWLLFILIFVEVVLDDIFNFWNHLLQGYIINLAVFDDGLTKMMSHLLKHVCIEMQVCVLAKITSTKTSFKSKGIYDAQLFPSYDSSSSFFCFLNTKSTVIIAKYFSLFFKHIWKYSFFVFRIIFGPISVHENIFLSWMTV